MDRVKDIDWASAASLSIMALYLLAIFGAPWLQGIIRAIE